VTCRCDESVRLAEGFSTQDRDAIAFVMRIEQRDGQLLDRHGRPAIWVPAIRRIARSYLQYEADTRWLASKSDVKYHEFACAPAVRQVDHSLVPGARPGTSSGSQARNVRAIDEDVDLVENRSDRRRMISHPPESLVRVARANQDVLAVAVSEAWTKASSPSGWKNGSPPRIEIPSRS
jgi:hypothetical protein